MPSKLLILHGEAKSYCFTISCVPERLFLNHHFHSFDMFRIKYNSQTLTCKQKQRCGWLGPFKKKIIVITLAIDKRHSESGQPIKTRNKCIWLMWSAKNCAQFYLDSLIKFRELFKTTTVKPKQMRITLNTQVRNALKSLLRTLSYALCSRYSFRLTCKVHFVFRSCQRIGISAWWFSAEGHVGQALWTSLVY